MNSLNFKFLVLFMLVIIISGLLPLTAIAENATASAGYRFKKLIQPDLGYKPIAFTLMPEGGYAILNETGAYFGVVICDADGKKLNSWGTGYGDDKRFGTSIGYETLKNPIDIKAGKDGSVWILQRDSNPVLYQFSKEGEILARVGTFRMDDSQSLGDADFPRGQTWGFEILNDGSFLVSYKVPGSEETESGLKHIDAKGGFISRIDPGVNQSGKLVNPGDIARDPSGNLWIADNSAKFEIEIACHDAEGKFLSKFPVKSSMGFNELLRIAAGPDNTVFYLDRNLDNIQKFSPDGKQIGTFGNTGENVLNNAVDIQISADGVVHVLDYDYSKLTKGGILLFEPVQ